MPKDIPTFYEGQVLPDDTPKEVILFLKSINSYEGYIPSSDFTDYEYLLYLQYASAEELEKDIITEDTYVKIMKILIYEEVK